MTQENTKDFSKLVQNLEKGYNDLAKWRDTQRIQNHDLEVALDHQLDKVLEFMHLSQELATEMSNAHKLNGVAMKHCLTCLDLLHKRVEVLEGKKNTGKDHP